MLVDAKCIVVPVLIKYNVFDIHMTLKLFEVFKMNEITQENKFEYLMSLKPDTVTLNDIFKLFNKTVEDGKIIPPPYVPIEPIVVEAGSLPSIKEKTTTTVGRYIFNLVTLAYAYGDKWPYCNEELRNDGVEDLMNDMCDELLMGRITGEEYGKFQTRLIWLNNFTEIFVPGVSLNLLVLPDDIKRELERLIKDNKECIINGNVAEYVNKVEKPILAFAKKWYIDHNEPGWLIYAKGGKPDFGNTFKSMFLETGPILDIATGKFTISTAAYIDGIPPEEYHVYGNKGVFGAYNRAVNTQYSGAKTKEFAVAFQSLVVTEEDCGSNYTIGIDVTPKNKGTIKWRWIRDPKYPNEFILVTPDDVDKYVGKHVEFRSPMFCMSDNLCWKCMGDLYRRMGLKNAGLASQRLTSTFMNKSLKAMHNQTQSTTTINWSDCVYEEK